jgi:muconolactone delta-isomerase
MRFLVVATPKTTPPPDMIPMMIDRSEEWQQRYTDAGKFEAFGLFPGGGGFAIADVADEAELHRMILEMPFSPFSDHQVTAIVDPATGWRQSREAIAAMMAAA